MHFCRIQGWDGSTSDSVWRMCKEPQIHIPLDLEGRKRRSLRRLITQEVNRMRDDIESFERGNAKG